MVKRLTNICFTIYEYNIGEKNEDWVNRFESIGDIQYYVVGKETCPDTKRKHLQGYIEFTKEHTFNKLQKNLKNIHFEGRLGTQEEAIKYCKKEGDYQEYGTPKQQGKRTDLKIIIDDIQSGKTNTDSIIINEPMLFHQYGRTLEKAEDIALRTRYRNWTTQGILYWGKTGTGKTYRAFQDFSPSTHYVLNLNDNGWWDGYKGQETVIINEFRGQITYSELLDLVDKYPKTVKRRGREPVPFLAKTLILTSPMRIEDIYHRLNDDKDSFDQFYRRFKCYECIDTETVKITEKYSEGNTMTSSYLPL